MGRKLRSSIPQTNKHLIPQWPYLKEFREANKKFKDKQKHHYDRGHRARDLSPIPDNTDVWVKSEKKPVSGRVVEPANAPRSYVVATPSGLVERNRRHLNIVPQQESQNRIVPASETSTGSSTERESPPSPQPIMTRSRTGTTLQQPDRYGSWRT